MFKLNENDLLTRTISAISLEFQLITKEVKLESQQSVYEALANSFI